MNDAPRRITLEQWDRRYERLRAAGVREPAYGGPLGRHVKDGDLTEPPVHKAVGDGKVPTEDIINAADSSQLEWLIVELDSCETDMTEAVAKSVKFLASTGLGKANG